MNAVQKKNITEKAREVTNISEKFQLIHATYACQSIIKELVIQNFSIKYEDLRKRIEEKMSHKANYEAELEEKKRLDMLIRQKNFHIDVAYIETKTEDTARVIKIDNAFVINLSKELEKKILDKDGNYNYEVIQKIRQLMAHELGHLILHTDELLHIDGTQGSKLITDEEKEEEANYFGEQLLHFRKERNEKIYRDGGAHRRY